MEQNVDGNWTGTVEGTTMFAEMINKIPDTFLSQKAKKDLDPLQPKDTYSQSTNIFPWQAGTSMFYGKSGIHNNGFTGEVTGWQAVDMLSDGNTQLGHAPNKLLAVTSGTIGYRCADVNNVAIRIGNFFYTHLVDNSKLQKNTQVNQGEELGQLKVGWFGTRGTGCGYAEQTAPWFHVHWGFPNADQQIENWTLSMATNNWTNGSTNISPNGGWILANSGGSGTCDATSLPSGYTKCAEEGTGNSCSFSGSLSVYYGAASCFKVQTKSNGVSCVNESFGGDPLSGVHKACYINNPPPPSCPQSGGVLLYWNADYNCNNSSDGYRLRTGTGWQNVNDGSFNDKASSLKVPSGWSAMLYENADRGGAKGCYNSDISDFGTLGNFPGSSVGVNDQVSSMEVFSNTTCGGASLPSSPTLSSPGNSSSNAYNYDLTFQWNAASGATGYQVEWWGGTYSTMQPCVWTSSTSCHIGTVVPGYTYSWHVKSRNSYGESTSWSPTWTFTIQPQPTVPSAPTLSSPGNGSSNASNYALTFQWNSVSGATGYQVEWWGGPYSTMQPCTWTSSTSCSVGLIAPGYTYSWHVKSRNSYGESPSWSPTWIFTIQPAPLPDLLPFPRPGASDPIVVSRWADSPSTTTLLSGQTAYFYWGFKNIGSSNAGAYHVKVYIDNTLFIDYPFGGLNAGDLSGFDNWAEAFSLTPGSHIAKIVVDANNQVTESNETNNTWTGNVTWRDPNVQLNSVFTTDDFGPAGLSQDSSIQSDNLKAESYKTSFNIGDPVRLYLNLTNELVSDQTFAAEWQVLNPAGRAVSELSATETKTLGTGGWWTWLSKTIPTNSLRGLYTFIGKITYNSVTITQTTSFSIVGAPSVEVYDVHVINPGGGAASLEVSPYQSPASEVTSNTIPTFNAGDVIELDINTSNDVTASETATFKWEVIDPLGRALEELSWNGDLNSSLGSSVWNISPTIPTNAITGDYVFTGSITHGGRTTMQSQTFLVVGTTGPANDSFGAPIIISSVPYSGNLDVWKATTSSTDPSPASCGVAKNSNSVWYRYTALANGLLEVNTQGSDYDTVIAIWTGSINNLTLVDCNDDDKYGNITAWIAGTAVTAGTTYYIEVMDYDNPGGGNLILFTDFAQTISNDDFNTPTTIRLSPYNITQDIRGAVKASDDPAMPGCNRQPGLNSVWYQFTPAVSTNFAFDTRGSNFDTLLSVWTGSRGSLTMINCNDDVGYVNGIWNTSSILSIPLTSGRAYYIEVSEYNGMVDVNGASATGLDIKTIRNSEKPASASLLETKTEIDRTGGLTTGLETKQTENITAQLSGGMLNFNIYQPINILVGGILQERHNLTPRTSTRVGYPINSGPVVVQSGDTKIIASERVAYTPDGGTTWTDYSELMGIPVSQLGTTYWFPIYDNVTRRTAISFGNVGTANTTVTITLGGTVMGTYNLTPSQSMRFSYPNANGGPMKLQSSGSVPIVASQRFTYSPNNGLTWTGFSETNGLPASQMNTSYMFSWYNNVNLNTQLRFANAGAARTTVTVTIGGVVRGTYILDPNQSTRVSYAGLNTGPVKVTSSGGINIIAAERVTYTPDNGANWSSYSELMGLPASLVGTSYWFPVYDNVSRRTAISFGNVGTANTTITIKLGGILQGTYALVPNQSIRFNYPDLDGGPMQVESSGGVPIIVSQRFTYSPNNGLTWNSFFEMNGLPASQLSTSYLFSWYNNNNLNTQLRFAVP